MTFREPGRGMLVILSAADVMVSRGVWRLHLEGLCGSCQFS